MYELPVQNKHVESYHCKQSLPMGQVYESKFSLDKIIDSSITFGSDKPFLQVKSRFIIRHGLFINDDFFKSSEYQQYVDITINIFKTSLKCKQKHSN